MYSSYPRYSPEINVVSLGGITYTLSHSVNNLIYARERGVEYGQIRYFRPVFFDEWAGIYYAERILPSMFRIRAPMVWWRRIDINERTLELEDFVHECARVKGASGWEAAYFKKARELSKRGFIEKLKGEGDE